ncbi:MAG: glycosyltransferase [Nitrospira sp.]|nr:glycosyltransferase [Nitrospira sp.]
MSGMVEMVTAYKHRQGDAACVQGRLIRVLYLFPGEAEGSAMIFAKKQVEVVREAGVAAETFCLASRTDLRSLRRESIRLRGLMDSFRPDLVHAQYGTMTAFVASLIATVPLVITFRGSDLNPAPSDLWIRSALRRCLSQYAARKAARNICVSQGLARRLWWAGDRTVVLPSGVDTNLFVPRSRSDVRQELGWAEHERIVLFNAGLSPAVKRLDLAQAAVSEASKVGGPIRFVTLDGRVPHSTVATMLNGADCLLLTSDWEGSPTIVQEALACNLPVVSVDVGDVRERLQGVVPSKIVERNPQALASGLAEMLARPVRSNGRCFTALVAQEHIVRRTIDLYREVLGPARVTC